MCPPCTLRPDAAVAPPTGLACSERAQWRTLGNVAPPPQVAVERVTWRGVAPKQESVTGKDSPGVRRGVYRCALRALLRGLRNPTFKEALVRAGGAHILKVPGSTRMLHCPLCLIWRMRWWKAAPARVSGALLHELLKAGFICRVTRAVSVGLILVACGVRQDFVGSADAAVDPDLRVMAEAILGALQSDCSS